jgi:hypothetical protein
VVAPALGAASAARPSAEAHAAQDRSGEGRGAITRLPAILPAAVLVVGSIAGSLTAPAPLHGIDTTAAEPSAWSATQLALAVAFAAVGTRAVVRPPGPWSPRLALLVAVAAIWLVLLSALGALAVGPALGR